MATVDVILSELQIKFKKLYTFKVKLKILNSGKGCPLLWRGKGGGFGGKNVEGM